MTLSKFTEVVCDACNARSRLENTRMSDDWPGLRKLGWTRGGDGSGNHYCPSCSKPQAEAIKDPFQMLIDKNAEVTP